MTIRIAYALTSFLLFRLHLNTVAMHDGVFSTGKGTICMLLFVCLLLSFFGNNKFHNRKMKLAHNNTQHYYRNALSMTTEMALSMDMHLE